MSRIVKNAQVRRKELIEIAMGQFLSAGYEGTSIRSILKEADGEIGMFYHYFKSKDDIYQAVLTQFNDEYLAFVEKIMAEEERELTERLQVIFEALPEVLKRYRKMKTEVHPEIMAILHRQTLESIVPMIELVITRDRLSGKIRTPQVSDRTMASFLLYGISGVIHDVQIPQEEKQSQLMRIIDHFVNCQVTE